MADYISRNEAINAIKSLESSMPAKDNYAKGYDAALGRVLIAVREVRPAADVQPIDRWINVNDRLPKEQETVIVYEKDYGVMWGDYQGIKYSQPVWIVRKSGLIIRTTEVTHWRHLPKPPKQ